MVTREQARVIAGRAADGAYYHSAYTPTGWVGVATFLADRGFDEAEIEWTLWSKHMRWAADSANRSAYVTASNFKNYATRYGLDRLREDARKGLGKELGPGLAKVGREILNLALTNQTGADLAGACEGEQIATLIDLVQMVALGQHKTKAGAERLQAKAAALVAEIKARGEA